MNVSKIYLVNISPQRLNPGQNKPQKTNDITDPNDLTRNKINNQLAALAILGSSLTGMTFLNSCSTDDGIEPDRTTVQETNSTQEELQNLTTPAQRISYITRSLGLDNGINRTGKYAACNKVEKADGSFDEIYSQRMPNSYIDGDSLLMSGIVIHRNTDDFQTNNTGVRYIQRSVDGENGALLSIRKYLDDDEYLSVKKGDVEYITIAPDKRNGYIYSVTDADGRCEKEKLYKDENGIVYKGTDKLSPYSFETGGEMPAAIGFSTAVDDWKLDIK